MVDTIVQITLNGTNVSDYLVGENNISTTSLGVIDAGTVFIDTSAPAVPLSFQEIQFSLKIDSFVHLFTGLIKKITLNDSRDRYKLDIVNTSYRYLKKTATNKFRQDSGNGNAITIMQNLNDEYTPEITYDGTSMPVTTFTFSEQSYQNKYINEIYDFISGMLNRQWWVDKDKILNVKTRTFPLVSEPLTEANIDGALIIDTDTSKMANNVIVDGAKLTTNITQTATGTGTTTFSLDYVPSGNMKVDFGGTNERSVVLEGTDNYESDYDCYVRVGDRKVVFLVAPTSSQAINFKYEVVSMIHEEAQDGASINAHNITIDKVITEENITKQEDATVIIQNYLDLYSEPLQLISAKVHFSSQSQISNWVVGNKININYTGVNTSVNDDFKIVGGNYHFGENGVYLDIQFSEFPESNQDMLKNLILKVKQREERERRSNINIVKYFFWGSNVYIELENMSAELTNGLNGVQLILDHPSQGQIGTHQLGPIGAGGTITNLLVFNSDRGFTDNFEVDRWFEQTGSTNAVFKYDSGSTSYLFNTGSTYFSRYIENNNNTYTRAYSTIDADDSVNWTTELISEEGTVFETIGTTPSSITSGSRFKFRQIYTGTLTSAELRKVNIKFLT